MATFIDDATLKTHCANLYSKATSSDLAPHQVLLVTEANNQAYAHILQYLNARGFTDAQIALWRDAQLCNRELGIYCFILQISIGKRLTRAQLDHYGRWIRPEEATGVQKGLGLLDTVALFDSAGNKIVPANKVATDYYGKIDYCDNDDRGGYTVTPYTNW